MKCKKCRREIEDNSIFCNWCGQKQITMSDEIPVPKPTMKASGEYTAQVMVDGVRVRVTGDNEKDYYAKARAVKEGLIEQRKPENRTVRSMVDEYIKARENIISPATIDGYKRKAKYNLQSLYNLRVRDLSTAAVQTAISDDLKRYSGKTVIEAWNLIKAATGVKVERLVLPSKKPIKKSPTYSVEDIRKIIIELSKEGGQIECAGLLAMWVSLRRSEIMGLRWKDIGEDCIRVQGARVYDENHKLVEKTTKTDLSERTIPCDEYILSRLKELPKTGRYVFTISTAGIWQGIDRVCRNAGVEHGYLHSFRHTNATIMEMIGVPSLYANRRGGWANDHVRVTHYATTMTEGDKAVAQTVDTFFTGLVRPKNDTPLTQEED